MTSHDTVPVQGQRYVTVGTLYGLAAASAGNKITVSSPVHEEHDLLMLAQFFSNEFIKTV